MNAWRHKLKKFILLQLAVFTVLTLSVTAYCATVKDFLQSYAKTEIGYLNDIRENGLAETLQNAISSPDETSNTDTFNMSQNIVKTASETLNPFNEEWGMIAQAPAESTAEISLSPNYLTNYKMFGGASPLGQDPIIYITPILAVKDSDDNLIVWMTVHNRTDHNLQINGFDELILKDGDNVVASGTDLKLKTPMKYAHVPEAVDGRLSINLGVEDGLPTGSFLRVVFTPGNYNEEIPLSEMKIGQILYLTDKEDLT